MKFSSFRGLRKAGFGVRSQFFYTFDAAAANTVKNKVFARFFIDH